MLLLQNCRMWRDEKGKEPKDSRREKKLTEAKLVLDRRDSSVVKCESCFYRGPSSVASNQAAHTYNSKSKEFDALYWPQWTLALM